MAAISRTPLEAVKTPGRGWRVAALSVCAAILAVTALFPTTAPAAPGTAAVIEAELDMQYAPAPPGQESFVIISAKIPDSVKLPVSVRIPIPEGARLDWSGEILGQGLGQDPQREARIKDGVGGRYAEFTVSQARIAQIEAAVPTTTVDGQSVKGSLGFVLSAPAPLVSFSVVLPPGMIAESIDPEPAGDPQSNQAGEQLFTLKSAELKVGERRDVTVVFAPDGGAGSPAASGTDVGRIVVIVAAVALVLAVGVLVFVMRRQQRVLPEKRPFDE